MSWECDLNKYYKSIDNAESFQEFLEDNYTLLGQHDGDNVWVNEEKEAFKVSDSATWVNQAEDSYWDYDQTEVEYDELIEMLINKNGEKK